MVAHDASAAIDARVDVEPSTAVNAPPSDTLIGTPLDVMGEVRVNPRTGFRVVSSDRALAFASTADGLYTLVERSCHNLVARGGSDCSDLGLRTSWALRFEAGDAGLRWVAEVSADVDARPHTLRVDDGVVWVVSGRRRRGYRAIDGSPLR